MKYLLFIGLLVAVLITAGCISENKNTVVTPTSTSSSSDILTPQSYPSYFEITNIWVKPLILPKESQNIAPVYTLVGFTVKNTGSVATHTFSVGVTIYDINNEYVCHGVNAFGGLSPRQKMNISVHCWGSYAGDKSLKDPEIEIV